MNICVVGAGSLGLLFAAKCALSNNQIYLVTHSSEQSQVISEQGIELKVGITKYNTALKCLSFNEHSSDNNGFSSSTHIDCIFLMVKQIHINNELILFLKRLSDTGTKIVCFQNGIGHVEKIIQHIPKERVFTAITSEAALKESHYQVKHTGKGMTWIGNENKESTFSQDEEKKLINMLENAGFMTNSSKNIINAVWNKLLINSVVNPLTAIFRVRNGELIRSSEWMKVMKALYEEGRIVANCLDIELSEHLWEQLIEVCDKTSMNISSMYKDIIEGRVTEIEWINGSIIRIAEQRQLRVPTHRTVYHMIKGMESSIKFSCDN